MSAFSRLIQPLRSAVAAFFKHDIAVRRDGDAVKLVLEQRPPAQPGAVVAGAVRAGQVKRRDAMEHKEREELAQIRAELSALLNQLPETRSAMRHLVFVEQALAKKGLRALHKVPLDVLRKALEQLEGLVTNWSPVGLANLRSKMAVAVLDREHMPETDEHESFRTAAVLDTAPARPQPEPEPSRSDDEALAAAYAALGALAPAAAEVQMQGELGSASAKVLAKPALPPSDKLSQISLRELQD
jgi:hypothetical protein